MHDLLLFITGRVAGEEEADALAVEVREWIDEHIPEDYPWPGNVRELEQCVRNILVRNAYHPPRRPVPEPGQQMLEALATGEITADELLTRYCTLVYAKTGSYQEAARLLDLDRRTVKSRVDPELLSEISGET